MALSTIFLSSGCITGFYILSIYLMEHQLLAFYQGDRRIRRLVWAYHEFISCIFMIIVGAIMLAVSNSIFITERGLWQAIFLPSFLIGGIYTVVFRADFPGKFIPFLMIHHVLSGLCIVLFIVLRVTGVVDLDAIAPHILFWNGASIPTLSLFSWYSHHLLRKDPVKNSDHFIVKIVSVFAQRVWRLVAILVGSVLTFNISVNGVITCAVMHTAIEVFDIQDQVRSLIQLKKKRDGEE